MLAAAVRARGRGTPTSAVLEYFADDLVLPALDKGDDLHPAATLGTHQWIILVDTLDNYRPPASDQTVGRGAGGC